MKLSRFIIVKFTLFLIFGICLGFFLIIPLLWSLITSSLLLCVLFGVYFFNKTNFKTPISFGILAFILTISIGVLSVNVHNKKLQKSHYSNVTVPIKSITFKIRDILKPSMYYDKYVIQILKINDENVTGKSLLNIQKDTLNPSFAIDDVFFTSEHFSGIFPPLNPNQFNYKTYLERQYIYNQIITNQNRLLRLPNQRLTLFGVANRINTYVNSRLKTYPFGKDELAIINALLLGQRQDISGTLYKNYTKAGAVHILAVSGLHVGILLLLLNYLFSPIERFKNGKLIKTICIIILIWSFAILTGLSPSVSRATLMFSLVAISMNSNRPSNIFNTVAISAFLLLLWNPMLLFDVGFQLSYLAVLGIITFQPTLSRLWYPKHKLSKLFWNTLTVTMTAQLGVLPISIYYFHQFPGLFFLSNLVIVPFLGYILGFGILILILASLQILPTFLAIAFNKTIGIMNAFVNWVASQDQFVFKSISIAYNSVLAIYLVFICLIYAYSNPKFKSILFVLLACISLQLTFIYNNWSLNSSDWILFHKNRQSILTYRNAHHLDIYNNTDSLSTLETYPIKDYAISKAIKAYTTQPLKSVYSLNNKTLIIVDSFGVYNVKSFKPHYVLLSQSPKINLSRLIDSLKPKEIIADGSNYKSYIERWEATCKHKKIPFYQTGKKGAYIFK
ncbi:ComEC/Rec2 family competence protein [Formosa sp. PL04]|uniref:ComEC/Rec2 family competence protein n=1 Tax=Formosa sp. PL04 TaxID=3081755 RepID=UPI002981C5FF|nr:ComEC/Rec2 family competence protein [Formosa sp. PL04]MDW5287925.1 ComEC/Rec2 family competence protein [Formosa sp. PL04]